MMKNWINWFYFDHFKECGFYCSKGGYGYNKNTHGSIIAEYEYMRKQFRGIVSSRGEVREWLAFVEKYKTQ